MKKWWRVFIVLMIVGQWSVAQVSAQSQSISEGAQIAELTEQENLIAQLQELETLEQYEIRYALSNLRNQHTMAEVQIIGDQRTGDAHIILDFYYRNASPNHYRLELVSYNHFDLVYAKQFAFLQSMAFFKQVQFPAKMHDEMAMYADYYVALDPSHVNATINRSQWVPLLQLLPKVQKLSELPARQFYHIDGKSFLSLEKLAIPEYLFENEAFLSFDFQWDMRVLRDKVMTEQWRIQSLPKLQVAKTSANSQFKVRVNSELEAVPFESTQLSEAVLNNVPKFERTMHLDGTDIATKLKKIQLFYDANRQKYQADLEGVTENVNWNLLGEGATTLKSYDFKVSYTIQPTTKKVPKLFEIERMTQSEFSYILAQHLAEKELVDGNE